MPPHCDSLDGPVVTAARAALAAGDVDLVLPFVPPEGDAEVCAAFDRVLPLRDDGGDAWETAQQWFFETVVRIHRAGEGASYTGLKPAGLSVGPVIPLAERAIESGSSEELADFLSTVVHDQLKHRLEALEELGTRRNKSLEDERRYVQAMLGLQVYSHHLYLAMIATGHHESATHSHAD